MGIENMTKFPFSCMYCDTCPHFTWSTSLLIPLLLPPICKAGKVYLKIIYEMKRYICYLYVELKEMLIMPAEISSKYFIYLNVFKCFDMFGFKQKVGKLHIVGRGRIAYVVSLHTSGFI